VRQKSGTGLEAKREHLEAARAIWAFFDGRKKYVTETGGARTWKIAPPAFHTLDRRGRFQRRFLACAKSGRRTVHQRPSRLLEPVASFCLCVFRCRITYLIIIIAAAARFLIAAVSLWGRDPVNDIKSVFGFYCFFGLVVCNLAAGSCVTDGGLKK
jgi:hypothetical protein